MHVILRVLTSACTPLRRRFMNLPLVSYLYFAMGTFVIGVSRSNDEAKNVSDDNPLKAPSKPQTKQLPRGWLRTGVKTIKQKATSTYSHIKNVLRIQVATWKDNRIVTMMSSVAFGRRGDSVARRKSKGSARKTTIDSFCAQEIYAQNMNGVDVGVGAIPPVCSVS